jgi:hypothetical protein
MEEVNKEVDGLANINEEPTEVSKLVRGKSKKKEKKEVKKND